MVGTILEPIISWSGAVRKSCVIIVLVVIRG